MINVKECTIQWYVDDNKFTHFSEDIITVVVHIMKKHFEYLVIYSRNKHTFLGMNIELVKDVKIKIDMQSYIKESDNSTMNSSFNRISIPSEL